MTTNARIEGERCHGVVTSFLPRKGYGFIRGDDGSKVFVHYSDIRGRQYRTLVIGEEVEYDVLMNRRGPQAVDVVRLNPPPDSETPSLLDEGRTW